MIKGIEKLSADPSDEMANLLARFRAVRKGIEGTIDIRSLIKAGRKY